MKTITELRALLAAARKEIEARLPAIAQENAYSARVIAERNIINEGFNKKYSTHGLPAFFFLAKELNNKGKAEIKRRQKKKELMTWGDFREAQGLPNDHVTLSYSNEMWRGITIVKSERKNSIFMTYLGHTTIAGKNKMQWNFERYGDFFMKGLHAKDRTFLTDQAGESIVDILKKYF